MNFFPYLAFLMLVFAGVKLDNIWLVVLGTVCLFNYNPEQKEEIEEEEIEEEETDEDEER